MDDGWTRVIGRVVAIGISAVLGLAAWSAQTLPTGEPLAVESTALVPLGAEAALFVSGIRGHISIETRDERELRVVSREVGQDGADRPVGIWQDGQRMVIAPAPGDKGGPRYLHVEVPRRF